MAKAQSETKLGIIAGGGELPRLLIDHCRKQSLPFYVIAFEGHANRHEIPGDIPCTWLPLGKAGKGLQILKKENVTELVMIGRIKRPTFKDLRPDWFTARFFARLGSKALGDDGLLSAVIKSLESEGFTVRGIDDYITDLLAPAGYMGTCEADEQAMADIKHGIKVGKTLGELDIGQSVVVQQGLVLGVEAIEGTDALLDRVQPLARSGPGGVLVKLKKPQQEGRVDVPTLGVSTVENAAKAGLRGIAFMAGGALLVRADKMAIAANAHNMFLLGLTPDDVT